MCSFFCLSNIPCTAAHPYRSHGAGDQGPRARRLKGHWGMNLQPVTGWVWASAGLSPPPLPPGATSLNYWGVGYSVGGKYSSWDRLLSKGKGRAERAQRLSPALRVGQLTPLLTEGRLQRQLGPLPTPMRHGNRNWGSSGRGQVVQSPAYSPHLHPRPAPDTQLLSKPGHWDWLSRALGPCQQAGG